jgi:hypothetical protein
MAHIVLVLVLPFPGISFPFLTMMTRRVRSLVVLYSYSLFRPGHCKLSVCPRSALHVLGFFLFVLNNQDPCNLKGAPILARRHYFVNSTKYCTLVYPPGRRKCSLRAWCNLECGGLFATGSRIFETRAKRYRIYRYRYVPPSLKMED